MVQVGVRMLKNHLSHFLHRARDGEMIVVTDHGKPVARLVSTREGELQERMEFLVRDRLATWGGGKPAGLPSPVPAAGKPASRIVIEERR
ncbi:MAG: type II toxin-antitoxin system prevent-host-death family antitoxin [Planctomycetota bacterium]